MNPNRLKRNSIACRPDMPGISIIPILLALLLLSTAAFAVDADKKAHFGTGAGLGLALGTATYHVATEMGTMQRTATATGLSLIPGVANEMVDKYALGVGFSWADVVADGLGAVSGALAAELINGQLWVSASGKQIGLRWVW